MYHTVTLGAAQYNHSLLLLATGSCPVQTSWSTLNQQPSGYEAAATLLIHSPLCFSMSERLFNLCLPSAFFVFHPFPFLLLHPSVLFFPFFCLIFSPSGWLLLKVSHSLSVSLYNLLISPLPFLSLKPSLLIGFVFLWPVWLSRPLSGFSFLLQSLSLSLRCCQAESDASF